MAQNKPSTWKKVLGFLGIYEREDKGDTYGEEYSGEDVGRSQPYTPPQPNRRTATPGGGNSGARRRLTEGGGQRSSRDDGRSSRTQKGYDDYRTSRSRNRTSLRPARNDSQRTSARQEARQDGRNSTTVQRRPRTVMYAMHTLKDCCKVIDELIANNTVVLTMEDMEGDLMQRVLDTLSGAAFALDANIRRASDRTYLIAPNSVDLNDGYMDADEDEDF